MEESLSPLLLTKISFNIFSMKLESLKNRKIEDTRNNRYRLAWLKFVAASMKVNEIKDFLEFLAYRSKFQRVKKIYIHPFFQKFRKAYFHRCWKRYSNALSRKYSITNYQQFTIKERTNIASALQEKRIEEASNNIDKFLQIGNPDYHLFFNTVSQLDRYYAEEEAKRAKITSRINQIKAQELTSSKKENKESNLLHVHEEEINETKESLISKQETKENEEEDLIDLEEEQLNENEFEEDKNENILNSNDINKNEEKQLPKEKPIISDSILISSMVLFLVSFQAGLLIFHNI